MVKKNPVGEVLPVAVEEGKGLVMDGWLNTLNAMATTDRDKRESDSVQYTSLSYEGLTALYQSSWLAARIVDKPADDATREGFDLLVKDDEELGDEFADYLDDLELETCLLQAMKWQRLYGGAIILMGVNDGQADLSQPVNEEKIQSIDYLNVFDASEARPVTWQDNPAAEDYGCPLLWELQPLAMSQQVPRTDRGTKARLKFVLPSMQRIHASRVMVFPGTTISRRYLQTQSNPGINMGWGDGVLARCIKLVRDYQGSWDGVQYQLREFNQNIYKIKGLSAALTGNQSSKLTARMKTIEMARSIIRAVLLDKDDEDFERNEVSFTGVADTLRAFSGVLAAAADMPLSILMNEQGSGLGSSGAGGNDIRNYQDTIRSLQRRTLLKNLGELVEYVALAKDGPAKGKDVESWKIKFRSLQQMTEQELAEMYSKLAVADEKYLNMGALSALDIGKARFSGKPMKVEIVADQDDLETREEMNTEMAATQHEVVKTNLETHGTEEPPPPPKPLPKAGK